MSDSGDDHTGFLLECAMRAHDVAIQRGVDARATAAESANIAIKSLTLINGGAVVALLAFVGALATNDSTQEVSIAALIVSIWWFAIGVGLSATTAALAYLVNMLDADIISSESLTWEHPFVEQSKMSRVLFWIRTGVHLAALATALSVIVVFFFGVGSVSAALSELSF